MQGSVSGVFETRHANTRRCIPVQDDRQLYDPLGHPMITDGAHPDLIGPLNVQSIEELGRDLVPILRLTRSRLGVHGA